MRLRTLGWLFLACVAVALLAPFFSFQTDRGNRASEAQVAISMIRLGLEAYQLEYGKWPDFTGDGLFLDEKRQAQLMRVLQGKDEANNPRKIVFFEGKTATQNPSARGQYRGGFSPATGAYLDLQGNPYRIIIDADSDGQIDGPYFDDPQNKGILVSVIAWSLGKDGKQGSPANPRTARGSDDVTNWQSK